MTSPLQDVGEPTRLLDDAGTNPALHDDLSASARSDFHYDVDAGLSRFEATVASGPAPSPGGDAAGSSALGGHGASLKIVGWLLGTTLAVGGGAALSLREGPAQQADPSDPATLAAAGEKDIRLSPTQRILADAADARDRTDRTAPSEQAPSEQAPSEQAPLRADRADAPGSTADTGHGAGPSPARNDPARPSQSQPTQHAESEDKDALAREIKQLAAARRHLGTDPARSLRLTERGAIDFPDGTYTQEREGYAILALVALGRHDEARGRARPFLATYPSGTLSARIRRALKTPTDRPD